MTAPTSDELHILSAAHCLRKVAGNPHRKPGTREVLLRVADELLEGIALDRFADEDREGALLEPRDIGLSTALDTFLATVKSYTPEERLLFAMDFLTAWEAGVTRRDEWVAARALGRVAEHVERLKYANPMNGDGHNFGLEKVQKHLVAVGGDVVSHEITRAQADIEAKEAEAYARLEAENAARHAAQAEGPSPCPECAQGKCQNCTESVLLFDDLVPCPCREAGHGTEAVAAGA